MEKPSQPILQGWKEIASYIQRDIRTAQRWELHRGLPVRRLPGEGRAAVYVFVPEMDEWLSRTAVAEESGKSELDERGSEDTTDRDVAGTTETSQLATGTRLHRHWAAALAMAAAVLVIGMYGVHRGEAGRTHRSVGQAASAPSAVEAHSASKLPDVDDLYLRGFYLLEQRTPASIPEAEQTFRAVLLADPNNARAWAKLAQSYVLIHEYNLPSDDATFSLTEQTARRALALDPGMADAHAVLGFIYFFWHGGDVRSAEPEFRTALSLSPQSAIAHSWYGIMLTYETRYTEAIEQLQMARHLDPASEAILANLALAIGLDGDRGKGLRMLEEAGQDHPLLSVRRDRAILCTVPPRDVPCYLRENIAISAAQKDWLRLRLFVSASRTYQQVGESGMWQEIAAAVRADQPGLAAEADAMAGRTDDAFRSLEESTRRFGKMRGLAADPLLSSLRNDPRFTRFASYAQAPVAN